MKVNFMLVDDNKIDLFVTQKIIEKVQIQSGIRKFINPNSAINFLKILDGDNGCKTMLVPDVILLDVNMPEMNGFQFLQEFNKLTNIRRKCIKIYMLSSSTNKEDVERARQQRSCIGFINKPITRQAVENILTDLRPNQHAYFCREERANMCVNL